MLYTLRGKLLLKSETFFALECGGVGYKVYGNARTLAGLPAVGAEASVYARLFTREPDIEVYGFLEEGALRLFELLITVSGVGPKTALGVLDLDAVPNVIAAILEKRADVLTRATGIGRKTAERIILELESRVKVAGSADRTKKMDVGFEVEEALLGLGYSRTDIRRALGSLPKEGTIEERLRAALKALGTRSH